MIKTAQLKALLKDDLVLVAEVPQVSQKAPHSLLLVSVPIRAEERASGVD
jgi:hypothetical protein